jgi:hypothetical protein
MEQMTQEQITGTIRAARDSVWAIDDALEKAAGSGLTTDLRGVVERNVSHLKLVVANPQIANSGEDISDLNQAITVGETALI